jgi:hypothetical protein
MILIGLLIPSSSYSMNNANDLTAQQYYLLYKQQKENTPLTISPHYIVARGYPREYSQSNPVLDKNEESIEIYATRPNLFLDDTYFHRVIHTQGTAHYHTQEKVNKQRLTWLSLTNLAALVGIVFISSTLHKNLDS